jgi:AcrR family transcriptional regulator
MARPLSEEKRAAILVAATKIVAVEGVEAATTRIAKAAGVAEGTIFTYFPTKDALLNELYLTIKRSVADAVVGDRIDTPDPVASLKAVWTNYLRWGLNYPDERRAMAQLAVSDRLTVHTRDEALGSFNEVEGLLQELIQDRFGGSVAYASAVMAALAEASIQFILANPSQTEPVIVNGFGALLRALGASK